MQEHRILGVDVGASGIKGAVVNISTGELLTERLRLPTPQPASPPAMAETFAELVKLHNWKGNIGCGFPSIVKSGTACSAANIDPAWIGVNVEELFSRTSGWPVKVLNDADAAGIAEMQFGAGKEEQGVVLLITLGSGLGSALFVGHHLVPNTEFGHMLLHNMVAERYAANSTRVKEELSWEEWGGRLNEFLFYINRILSPDLVILGGGVSKRFELYQDYLTVDCRLIPAQLLNNAGAIGAAVYSWQCNR